MNKNNISELELEFEASSNKKYKVKAIQNNLVYINKTIRGQLLGLYYLVSWKNYSKAEKTKESSSTVIHF